MRKVLGSSSFFFSLRLLKLKIPSLPPRVSRSLDDADQGHTINLGGASRPSGTVPVRQFRDPDFIPIFLSSCAESPLLLQGFDSPDVSELGWIYMRAKKQQQIFQHLSCGILLQIIARSGGDKHHS